MPWITPTGDTWLKTEVNDSSKLGDDRLRRREKGDKLGIISARTAPNGHWEILLAGPLTIGPAQVKSCFIYGPHWTGVAEVAAKAQQKQLAQAISQPVSGLPVSEAGKTVLPVPYLSQVDNALNPGGSCNVTCIAICLTYYGIKPEKPGKQLEDELYQKMEAQGLSRHSPTDLKIIAEQYGVNDYLTFTATVDQVKQALDSGRPCVVHGYFVAPFGHIVVYIGYDDDGFIVHDPWGEWHASGYDRNTPENNTKGKAVHYSYGMNERLCMTDGQFWVHIIDGKLPEPEVKPEPVKVEPLQAKTDGNLDSVKAIMHTLLKAEPVDSAKLQPDEKHSFKSGEAIEGIISTGPNNHVLVTLPNKEQIHGRDTWYVFRDHVKVEVHRHNKELTQQDIIAAAQSINVDPKALTAVVDVEANGCGFLPSGRPKILFEAHWFSDITGNKYDTSHPNISSRRWNRDLYIGGESEWNRFSIAASLNYDAAVRSASWGIGQIMGDHYPALGYGSAQAWVDAMSQSEGTQLLAMAKFIGANPTMLKALQNKQWASFARLYNGEGYAVNKYDTKLAAAFANL